MSNKTIESFHIEIIFSTSYVFIVLEITQRYIYYMNTYNKYNKHNIMTI